MVAFIKVIFSRWLFISIHQSEYNHDYILIWLPNNPYKFCNINGKNMCYFSRTPKIRYQRFFLGVSRPWKNFHTKRKKKIFWQIKCGKNKFICFSSSCHLMWFPYLENPKHHVIQCCFTTSKSTNCIPSYFAIYHSWTVYLYLQIILCDFVSERIHLALVRKEWDGVRKSMSQKLKSRIIVVRNMRG